MSLELLVEPGSKEALKKQKDAACHRDMGSQWPRLEQSNKINHGVLGYNSQCPKGVNK